MSRRFVQSGHEYATAVFGQSSSDDELFGSDGDDLLRGFKGNDTLHGEAGDDLLIGNKGHDELHGGDGSDMLKGGRGEDLLFGGEGDDVLRGGHKADILAGGAGDDRLFGGRGEDSAIFNGSILDYLWESKNKNWMQVEDRFGEGGTDKLKSIENLVFDDYELDLDGDNAALVKGAEVTTDEDTSTEFAISAWDFDGGTPEITNATVTGGGTLTAAGTSDNDATPMAEGQDFAFVFDPGDAYQHLGEGETATETATFDVVDGQGNTTTYQHEVTINGVNDAPEFAENEGTTEIAEGGESNTVSGNVSASDVDANDVLSFAVENGGEGQFGTLSVDDEGNWVYTLNNDLEAVQALEAGEDALDAFRIAVMDQSGGEDYYELSVKVLGTSDPSVTLDFEDLEVEIGALAPLPEGYMGFDWSNAGYFLETDEFRGGEGTPFHEGATSGNNVVYNNASDDLTLSRDEAFDLESANFISTSRSEMELTVTGYLDGEETGSQVFLLSNDAVTEAQFDDAIFDSVDQVTFSTEFDVLGRFVMDDLEFMA